MQSVIILGRQPEIGIAELESLFGAKRIHFTNGSIAIIDLPYNDIPFDRLGGAVKIGEIQSVCDQHQIAGCLNEAIDRQKNLINSKINIGISAYGLGISPKQAQAYALGLKKYCQKNGYKARVVPNREPQLNSAQTFHNQLDRSANLEALLINYNNKVVIAKTRYVQDIDSYTIRDRGRPKRDALIGMLPPKLAQTIINLASAEHKPSSTVLLDPFCGTGVILQEATLMGFKVLGSDINPKMVEYSITNIDWLSKHQPKLTIQCNISRGDATIAQWPQKIDTIATETYLGEPLRQQPSPEKLNSIIRNVDILHKNFLNNIKNQINSGTRMCLAIPAWKTKNGFAHLPVIDQLNNLGYNRVVFEHTRNSDLIYHRPDQFVARELLILLRK